MKVISVNGSPLKEVNQNLHEENKLINNYNIPEELQKLHDFIVENLNKPMKNGSEKCKELHEAIKKYYNISKSKERRNYLPYDLIEAAFYAIKNEEKPKWMSKLGEIYFEDDNAMSTIYFGTIEFDVRGLKIEAFISWSAPTDINDDDDDDDDDNDESEYDEDEDDESEYDYLDDDDRVLFDEDSEMFDVGMHSEKIIE